MNKSFNDIMKDMNEFLENEIEKRIKQMLPFDTLAAIEALQKENKRLCNEINRLELRLQSVSEDYNYIKNKYEPRTNYHNNYDANFSDLTGKTVVHIEGDVGSDTIVFTTDTKEKYQLCYYQDCCADCSIEDICGDLNDILGSPILLAEEVTSDENPIGVPVPDFQESFTWTFYKLSTIKGSVTIRWYGSSNGYYSETATFEKLK